MRMYAEREGCIPRAKMDLFDRLVADVKTMPDLDPVDMVSCHAGCRALEMRHDGVRCVDGHFHAVGHDHSWLDLGDGVIADVYPVAGAVPFIVDASHWMVPWHQMYKEDAGLLDRDGRDRLKHERIAAVLVSHLSEHDLQP